MLAKLEFILKFCKSPIFLYFLNPRLFTVRLVLLPKFFYRKKSYNFIYFIMYSIVIRSFLIHTSQGISQRNLEKIPYIIGFGGNPDFDTIVEFPTVSLTFCYSLPLIRRVLCKKSGKNISYCDI